MSDEARDPADVPQAEPVPQPARETAQESETNPPDLADGAPGADAATPDRPVYRPGEGLVDQSAHKPPRNARIDEAHPQAPPTGTVTPLATGSSAIANWPGGDMSSQSPQELAPHGAIQAGQPNDESGGARVAPERESGGGTGASASLRPAAATTPNQKLLEQASQVAGNLQSQATELERREHSLNSQLSQLDQERRAARMSVRQQEESLAVQAAEQQERQAELTARSAELDRRAEELAGRESEVESIRADLDSQKAALADEAARELKAERDALEAHRAELDADHEKRTESLKHDLTQQLMTDEMRSERKQLDRDLEEWNRQRELQAREWQAAQAQHNQEVQAFEAERDQREADHKRTLESEQRQQARELDEIRQAFDSEQQEARSALQQERALMENRHLFQQEHLAKARNKFEHDQASFRQEMQTERTELERRVAMLESLKQQVAAARDALELRNTEVAEGESLLERKIRSAEASLAQHQERLAEARETWKKNRESQRAEITSLREHLKEESQSLKARKQRIDVLREELEGSHRESLELRLAVEELMAEWRATQPAQQSVDDEDRLNEAREAVSEHYRQMRDTLVAQRADLEDAQKQLTAQVAQQQKVYADHGARLAEREAELQQREDELRQQAAPVGNSEAADVANPDHWRQMQARWEAEKAQAERIIRDLLKQLGESEAA